MAKILEKGGPHCHENSKKVLRADSDRKLNGISEHPNQAKVRNFVHGFGLGAKHRGHLRDVVSYLRATKSGGWKIRTNERGDAVGTPLSRRRAFERVSAWDQRHKAAGVGDVVVRAAVDFVYGDPDL